MKVVLGSLMKRTTEEDHLGIEEDLLDLTHETEGRVLDIIKAEENILVQVHQVVEAEAVQVVMTDEGVVVIVENTVEEGIITAVEEIQADVEIVVVTEIQAGGVTLVGMMIIERETALEAKEIFYNPLEKLSNF